MKRLSQVQAVLQLATQRPLVRAADLFDLGVSTAVLTRLIAANKLERVGRGLYSLPGHSVSEHRSLAEASLKAPRGIVCLLSALRVHEIGTQASSEVWLALPQHTKAPRPERLSLRVVHMSGYSLTEGIDRILIDGVEVPVFDAEKTVADCFKFRNKIGLDVALEALKDGWRRGKLSMDKLWHYATIDRVTNVMRPYLESLEG
jgi:predicted transcriptional regulator of viral defense system